MASKRTRSATLPEADGNSSNVTDYIGSPTLKRQKGVGQPANTSARLTRSNRALRVSVEESPKKAASAIHQAKQQKIAEEEEEEDDDDDGSVHVPFNQVSSAVNEARLGPRRTVNGLQPVTIRDVYDFVDDDEVEEEAGEEDGRDGEVTEESPPKKKRGRPSRAMTIKQQNHQIQLENQLQPGGPRPLNKVNDTRYARINDILLRTGEAASRGRSSRKSTLQRRAHQYQDILEENAQGEQVEEAEGVDDQEEAEEDENARDQEEAEEEEGTSHQGEPESGDNEQDADDAAIQTAEDSAFIDAPRPHEQLPEVTCRVRSIGGMIKTLRHPAWTGASQWHFDPEMQCSTRKGGHLMEQARRLNDLLVDAADARHESDADESHEVTLDFLRQNNATLKGFVADISELVDAICARKLVAAGDLKARDIDSRKRFLRDISGRLIPMLVLVLQTALEMVPSEQNRSSMRLTLNAFTTQFLLRPAGWADRLTKALVRGLREWPIDEESDESDDDLAKVEGASKDERIKAREMFQKQLTSLYSAATTAAHQLEVQARIARGKAIEEQDRRKIMIAQRNAWAAGEREREEEERRKAQQYQNFVRFTQALKDVQDPMAERMRQATKARSAPVAPRVTVAPARAHAVATQHSKGKEKAVHHVEDDDDPFVINEDEDEMFPSPTRRCQTHGDRSARDTASSQLTRTWSDRETMTLIKGIREQHYTVYAMASRLVRSVDDVALKAAGLKKLFRDNYRERNVSIPAWAW